MFRRLVLFLATVVITFGIFTVDTAIAASRPKGYGMTAEMQVQKDSKYDAELAKEIGNWMEANLGKEIFDGYDQNSFAEPLKDGQVLCQLSQKLGLGSIKINSSNMAFKQMENIGNFLSAAEKLGVAKSDLFQTVDLYEKQNIPQVVNGVIAFARKASALGKTEIPFGPQEAEQNRREFTEEQLRAGQNSIGLQMGSNRGTFQAGQNFGRTRAIIDN